MSLEKETKAFEALTRLLRVVDECRALFDEAGMEYPAPLLRLLGDQSQHHDEAEFRARIDPPKGPARPAGVAPSWLYVPLVSTNAQTAVLALLRSAEGPVPVGEIISQIESRGVTASPGSIANVGTRLEKKRVIVRSKDGWALAKGAPAPLMNGKYVWGDREMFTPHEQAAYRRELVLHILRFFPEGLQNGQILARLQACDWVKAPVNKDLLKMDIEVLREQGRVRRIGASRKWALAEEKP